MVDKNMINMIQNDINNSNAIIINNNDNYSNIKKNFGSKYTDDISDSDDELRSYKNRNTNIINEISKNKKELKNKSKKDNKNVNENNQNIVNNIIKSVANNKNNDIDDNKNDEGEDGEEGEEEGNYEYTEELTKKVVAYVKYDDKIRELQAEIKNLNNQKKASEEEILKHLERLGETMINVTGGKLRINQYESKAGLKEDIIKEVLTEEGLKDPQIIEKIFDKIEVKRKNNSKIQRSLKRTFERNNEKKKK